MSAKLPSNRTRQIQAPERFTDLTKPEAAARLTQNLQNLAKEVSKDRVVETLPTPQNFTGESGSGYVRLSWGDVDDSLRRHRDCARIWRAKVSEDAHTDFNQNMKRSVIVEGVCATVWYDFLPDMDSRIYWLVFVNTDGVQSPPAGGLTIAAS